MFRFLPVLFILVLSACASSSAWNVKLTNADGFNYLSAIRPGASAGHTVLKTARPILAYAISKDGKYLAYISTEGDSRIIFVQQLTTALIVGWSAVTDSAGELEFTQQGLSYRSANDSIEATFTEIDARFKNHYGAGNGR